MWIKINMDNSMKWNIEHQISLNYIPKKESNIILEPLEMEKSAQVHLNPSGAWKHMSQCQFDLCIENLHFALI